MSAQEKTKRNIFTGLVTSHSSASEDVNGWWPNLRAVPYQVNMDTRVIENLEGHARLSDCLGAVWKSLPQEERVATSVWA